MSLVNAAKHPLKTAKAAASIAQLQQLKDIDSSVLNDPKKLVAAIKQMKFRWELHFDFLFLSRGKELLDHDFAVLFHDQKGDMPLAPEDVAAVLSTISDRLTSLPVKLSYAKVRKDKIIYTCVYIDLEVPEENNQNEGKTP